MPGIFTPFSLRSVILRNRIGVSPMQQFISGGVGPMTDWHLAHLGGLAIGGAGLVIAEVTAVSTEGRATVADTCIWNDEVIQPLARVASFVKRYGAVFGLQLGHAGRRGSCSLPWDGSRPISPQDGGWAVVAPSALPFDDASPTPHALSVDEIAALVTAFADGASRALMAGVQWLELHAAHGYLLHSFHSPLSNEREDAYGGSFENRVRFTREIVRSVRSVWPETLPLGVRLSCTEHMDGGWSIEDTVSLLRLLREDGVDLIDCSSGAGGGSRGAGRGPGFQVPFAEQVRKEAGIATAAVGLITEPAQAEEIITHDRADVVLMGRQFLREPRWVMRAAAELGQSIKLPIPYGQFV